MKSGGESRCVAAAFPCQEQGHSEVVQVCHHWNGKTINQSQREEQH